MWLCGHRVGVWGSGVDREGGSHLARIAITFLKTENKSKKSFQVAHTMVMVNLGGGCYP